MINKTGNLKPLDKNPVQTQFPNPSEQTQADGRYREHHNGDQRVNRKPASAHQGSIYKAGFVIQESEINLTYETEPEIHLDEGFYDGSILIQNDPRWSQFNTLEVLNRKAAINQLAKLLKSSFQDQVLDQTEIMKLVDSVDDISRAFVSKESLDHKEKQLIASLNELLIKRDLPTVFDDNGDGNLDVAEVSLHMRKLRGALALAFAVNARINPQAQGGVAVSLFQDIANTLVNPEVDSPADTIVSLLGHHQFRGVLSTSDVSLVLTQESIVPGGSDFPLGIEGVPVKFYDDQYYEDSKLYFNDIDRNESKNRGPFRAIVNDLITLSYQEQGRQVNDVPSKELKIQTIKITGLMKGLFSRSVALSDGDGGSNRFDFGDVFKSFYVSLNRKGKDAFLKKFSNSLVNMGQIPRGLDHLDDAGTHVGLAAADLGGDIHYDGWMDELNAEFGQGFTDALGFDKLNDYFEYQEDRAEFQQDVGIAIAVGGFTAAVVTASLRAMVGKDKPEQRKYFQQAAQSFADGLFDAKQNINLFSKHVTDHQVKPAQQMSDANRMMVKFGRGVRNYGPSVAGVTLGVTAGVLTAAPELGVKILEMLGD